MRSLVSGALGLAAVVVVVVVVLLVTGGSSNGYHFNLKLADADGLINGSEITVGGVPVGTVHLSLDGNDVDVQGNLDKGAGPIGRNATVYISAINLLGQKRLQLIKGNRTGEPAQSGYVIPASHVSESTDLDQVLDALSPTVRDRLGILLNEAGTAVAGRQTDIASLISALPPTISDATGVLNTLTGDNHTLADLIQSSDQTITAFNDHTTSINRLVGTLGQTSKSVALKKTQLTATLANAPQTLTSAQRFLAQLQGTVKPLGPAASALTNVAPELVDTINQLPSFATAAQPALRTAISAGPALTRLADKATPVVNNASSTITELATFSDTVQPLTATLNSSEDNLIATVANWSRAVEGQDNLSHVFRGEAAVTDQTLTDLVNRVLSIGGNGSLTTTTPTKTPAKSSPSKSNPVSGLAGSVSKTASGVQSTLSNVGNGVQSTLNNVGSGVSTTVNKLASGVGNVVNGLTGKNGGDKSNSTTSTTASGTSTTSSSGVTSLLNYLLKP